MCGLLFRLFFLLSLASVTSCVASSACIEPIGDYSHRSYVFEKQPLVRGKLVEYKLKINCVGRYQFFLGFIPDNSVVVEADDNGNKVYAIMASRGHEDNHSIKLTSHEISYKIKIEDEEGNYSPLVEEGVRLIPPYPFGFSPIDINIPAEFKVGESILITVSVEASEDFYQNYVQLDGTLRIPMH